MNPIRDKERVCARLSVAAASYLSKELARSGVVIRLRGPEIPLARLATCLLEKP